MKIERLEKNLAPKPDDAVTVKRMGNITEVRYMTNEVGGNIKKLDKDSYIDVATGEVKEFSHTENRADNMASVSRSLRNLRDILNANVTIPQNCLWITLTYRENMRDQVRLYQDFKRYNTRMRRYLAANGLPPYEYVAAAEPQSRGAWHLHVVMIFQEKAPFIENQKLAELWEQGFVTVKSLKGVDNPGLYLTAYLGDMELTEAFGTVDLKHATIKEARVSGQKRKKAIVKGARLHLYPVGFRLYRYSRGIVQPSITQCTEAEAMQEVQGAAMVFEKTIQLSTGDNVLTRIHYRQFNCHPKRKAGATYGEENNGNHADYNNGLTTGQAHSVGKQSRNGGEKANNN